MLILDKESTIMEIIKAAQLAHKEHWRRTSDESAGDKQATSATKSWQNKVISQNVCCEVQIADNLKERIDVIDLSECTAYELKVSGKNPHHEFYKDIFKVIVYNQNHSNKINQFVFLTEKEGADKLNKGMGKEVMQSIHAYDFSVKVIEI